MAMFTLQLIAPIASAAGMQSCSDTGGTCDEYDHAEDMTPHQQDWVEGTYEFDLVSTSSINLELTWAVREFERDSSVSVLEHRLVTPSSSPMDWMPTTALPPI